MFHKREKLVFIAFVQFVLVPAIQAMASVESKPKLPPLPSMCMRECRLMELFSEDNSFFTKLYPNNPNPLCPSRSRLPSEIKTEICKYVFDTITPARVAHGDRR